MQRGSFVAPRREAPAAPLRQSNKRGGPAFTVPIAALIGILTVSTVASALELPKPEPVEKYLGKAAIGPNYTVKPLVRSDGVMRIFDVDTSYGNFAFDGVEFTKLRIHELNAIAALEKMSQSEAFGKAFGRAALGPIKFGADLISNPAETVERSLSGIGNMFDRVGAGLSNNRADRDGFVDSLLGVSDTQRELAVDLDVDPYTDFPPLAQRLKEMAGVMAGGGLPIKAGLSFVPGGIGIAVSSVATFSDAKDTLRSKTAAQVIAETRATLLSRYFRRKREPARRKPELHAGRPSDHGACAQKAECGEHHCIHRARGRGGIAQRSILPSSTRADPCRAQRRTGRPCFIRHVWRATDQRRA